MATYHLPEIDTLITGFDRKMKDHLANLDDLDAAIKTSDKPWEIMDDWEARQLLRRMPPDVPTN